MHESSDETGAEATDSTGQRAEVREAYDDLAAVYNEQRSESPSASGMLDEFEAALSAGSRVLDAGCGKGTFSRELTAAHEVVGLDFSREQLRHAGDYAPGIDRVQGDMTRLPLAAGSVDAVTAFYSIIHVPTEEHALVFEEFARVLRPGGRLLVTVGGDAWEGENDDWLGSGVQMRWSFPALETTLDHLDDAGFVVDDRRLVVDEMADDDGATFPFVLATLDG